MPRGSRFALNRASRKDSAGRSLPSDTSMHYVELQLVCGRHLMGERPVLGAWFIESHLEQFDQAQVNERANNSVERQQITEEDGTTRLRFKMRCPTCGQQPVYRQEQIDAALGAIYQQGAKARIVQYAIAEPLI